ncbi:fibronectin type III domain-containing protein [Spirillospora sp. CA-142024]|uniref:fibronectin type III domain-containing protein n=1 Tax=Spirillospora sp. CA-142024 TaxID=3240036 RepID=UPI003D8F03E2
MAGTVKIPGVGSVPTKWAVAGGVAVVGIAGVAYWRYSNNKAAIAEESTPTVNDTTGESETVYPAYATDYAADDSYNGGAYPYPSYTTPSYGVTTTTQTPDPVTNSEWTQRSIEQLENIGVEAQAASLAVSRYLLKECVTATQADLVRQAVAALGTPPQGSFSIIVCPSAPSGNNGTGNTPTDAPPDQVKTLKATAVAKTSITLDWPPAARAEGYTVYKNGARHQTVRYSKYTAQGLRPNTSYTFDVISVGKDDHERGPAARVTVRTKK